MKSAITRLFFLLLLAMAGTVNAQQWEVLHTGVTEDLYDICCIDANTIFVCGQNGLILKTEDGGSSWQEKYSQTGYDWYKIKFFDSNIGFVFGDDDNSHDNNYKLLKTIDGGETWLDMGSPFNENFDITPSSCDLYLYDSDTLYVASNQLVKSTDGGNSFSQLEVGGLYSTQDLYFEENVGYIVLGVPGDFQGTHIVKTIDYGSSWEELLLFDEMDGVERTFFHDKDHISIFGAFGYDENEFSYEYNEIRTDNGFTTHQWLQNENLPIGLWPQMSGVCFSDTQNGIIVYQWEDFNYPFFGIVSYRTQDGGNTWFELDAFTCANSQFVAVGGCERAFYLALGEGNVYKLEGTYDGVSEEEKDSVFLNPVSNTLMVCGKENSIITLYDFLGRFLFQKRMTEGIQEIEIVDLHPGLYFFSIMDGGQSIYYQKILKSQ
ncbi:MAG: T9SS type A sorting domain-containing protein [Bacteroidales bacterium]|nr:T9SS type A sorting domain-containing protein [Bacteroidales bacterium]